MHTYIIITKHIYIYTHSFIYAHICIYAYAINILFIYRHNPRIFSKSKKVVGSKHPTRMPEPANALRRPGVADRFHIFRTGLGGLYGLGFRWALWFGVFVSFMVLGSGFRA